MPLTYNQIIKLSREFADAHYQIKNFGNGWVSDEVLHNLVVDFKYPLMWMEDRTMPLEPGMEVFGFRIHFVSLVAELENRNDALMSANKNEIKSDMLECAKDYLSYWTQDHNYPELRIEKNASRETLEDVTADNLTGCYIDITFKQAYKYNKCAIPMGNVDPASSNQVSLEVNGTSFISIDCGSTYDLIVKDTNGATVGTYNALTKVWEVPAAGTSSYAYDIILNSVDTGQDVTVDGTDITINLGDY